MNDTRPGGWAPSQLDMMRAEAKAWEQWHQQNRHVRLTRPIPPRPIQRVDLLLAAALGAAASAVLMLIVGVMSL